MNIYDVAQLAGVSIATVSRVVNDSPMVSEKTKIRVRKVMEENGYIPNVYARALGQNSIKTIGLVCPDVSDNYMASAVAFLESHLRENGYDCMLYCSGNGYEERRVAVNSIMQKCIDALVIIGSVFSDAHDEGESVDYICQAAKKVPVFLLNASIQGENIYCALCDDYDVSYQAVMGLLKSGRRRILYLSDSTSHSANKKRMGYEQALRDFGLEVDPDLILYTPNHVMETKTTLLAHRDISFDAVFATDDGIAIGAIKYAKARKLSIPEQLSIIGYNNSELAVACEPELSTVDSRLNRLCKIIIDSMMLVLQKKQINQTVYVKGHLIRRGTTDF